MTVEIGKYHTQRIRENLRKVDDHKLEKNKTSYGLVFIVP